MFLIVLHVAVSSHCSTASPAPMSSPERGVLFLPTVCGLTINMEDMEKCNAENKCQLRLIQCSADENMLN